MSAPIAVTGNSRNAKDLSSLTSEEFNHAILATKIELSSFVSKMFLQGNNLSVHDTVLIIDEKIRQALAVLGENQRRITSFGDCNGVAVSSEAVASSLKSIESLAEQLMKRNDVMMEQAITNEDAKDQSNESPKEQDGSHGRDKGNNNRKRCRQNQNSGTGNTKKRRSQESTQLCQSLPADSTDAFSRDQLNLAPSDRDTQKIRNLNHDKWQKRFQELVKFKRKHGHCNVPSESGSLGSWVTRNRMRYNKAPSQRNYPLTPDQIDKLNRLGFLWKAKGKARQG